jgi:membrane-anchored protein YejM (alkaline phosphatase superfamily)
LRCSLRVATLPVLFSAFEFIFPTDLTSMWCLRIFPGLVVKFFYPTFTLRLSGLFLHPKQMGAQALFTNISIIFSSRCLICNMSNTSTFSSLQFWQTVHELFLNPTFGNCMSGGDCGFAITAVNSVNLLGTVDKQSCRTSQVFQTRTL